MQPGSTTAWIAYGAASHPVGDGVPVTFGRGSAADVRLPEDGMISRIAGIVELDRGYLLVRNTSASKAFVLRPKAGEDHRVGPGAVVREAWTDFEIVLVGAGGRRHRLRAHAPGVRNDPSAAPSRESATTVEPYPLTARQRQLLAALCRPMVTRRGDDARPATYREMATELGLSDKYVRNEVARLRTDLTGHGVPGLADDPDHVRADYLWPLARLTIQHGWHVEPGSTHE